MDARIFPTLQDEIYTLLEEVELREVRRGDFRSRSNLGLLRIRHGLFTRHAGEDPA